MAVKIMTTIQTWVGLSGDTKPTSPSAGSTFYETDTKTQYIYDGLAWKQAKVDGWAFSSEMAVGTTVVKASAGQLHGVLIETDGTNDVLVQMFNHASTATNPMTSVIKVAGSDNYGGAIGMDNAFSLGCVIVLSGTNGVATVYYR